MIKVMSKSFDVINFECIGLVNNYRKMHKQFTQGLLFHVDEWN